MADDPRRVAVKMVARIGRETQLHLDERYRHFQITDALILFFAVLLLVLAVFNVYHIRVLYNDMSSIVFTMDAMHSHLLEIQGDMADITNKVAKFDQHMAHMEAIDQTTVSMAKSMPRISNAMNGLVDRVGVIEQDMGMVRGSMDNIRDRVHLMNTSVAVMRENLRQVSLPMGMMNPFMP